MSADSAVAAKDMSVMRLQSVRAEERLGTRWGDEVQSNVRRVDLRRVSQEPLAQNVLHYSSKDYRGRSVNSISLAAGRVELSVRDDGRRELPIFRDNGRYYLRGTDGQAYRLIYRNNSSQTFEIVASVDGLDVLSGKPGSRYNSGYVLRPHSTLEIEGFRKSDSAVASFIFSSPGDSYAAHSDNGSVRNTRAVRATIPKPFRQTTDMPNRLHANFVNHQKAACTPNLRSAGCFFAVDAPHHTSRASALLRMLAEEIGQRPHIFCVAVQAQVRAAFQQHQPFGFAGQRVQDLRMFRRNDLVSRAVQKQDGDGRDLGDIALGGVGIA